MKQTTKYNQNEEMNLPMAAYLLDAIAIKRKNKLIRINMECRRKLEIKREEYSLKRAISEFDFG